MGKTRVTGATLHTHRPRFKIILGRLEEYDYTIWPEVALSEI